MSLLGDKLKAIHGALDGAALPHAFGGAIALAYCVGEPRATIDVDLNLFVSVDAAAPALGTLPTDIQTSAADIAVIERDGQARLWWDNTPIDLFFAYDPFHWEAATRAREVQFEGSTIPVLDCTDLAIFKSFFARRKDFADIEAMGAAGSVNRRRALATIKELLGEHSRNYTELAAVFIDVDRR